jgi:hypothetical protein
VKKIIKLTESELIKIVSRVLTESSEKKYVITEQKLNKDGTYTTKSDWYFHSDSNVVSYQIGIVGGTIVSPNTDGKSVKFKLEATTHIESVEYPGSPEIKIVKLSKYGRLNCGENFIRIDSPDGYFYAGAHFWKYDPSSNTFITDDGSIKQKKGGDETRDMGGNYYTKYGNRWGQDWEGISKYYDELISKGGIKNQIFVKDTAAQNDGTFTRVMNKLFCDGNKLKNSEKTETKTETELIDFIVPIFPSTTINQQNNQKIEF